MIAIIGLLLSIVSIALLSNQQQTTGSLVWASATLNVAAPYLDGEILQFNVTLHDTNGMHVNSSMVIPSDGVYQFMVFAVNDADMDSTGSKTIALYKNNNPVLTGPFSQFDPFSYQLNTVEQSVTGDIWTVRVVTSFYTYSDPLLYKFTCVKL